MFELLKIENERSQKLYYDFVCQMNPDWKKSYILSCILYHQKQKTQGLLSDYEFFLKTHEKRLGDNSHLEYLFLVEDKPVTLLKIIERDNKSRDISFSTLKEYQNKGFATEAVKMVEHIIFQNKNICFTTIIDMNPNHYSGKIAEKLGYFFEKKTGYYIKTNPNLSFDKRLS